jgi:hypothetical protein
VGAQGTGAQGDAVQFGQKAAILEVQAGAVFDGDIAANASVADTLALAGTTAGTLDGFGTSITGFSAIDVDAGATWTLGGTIAGAGTISVGGNATVSLTGTVSVATLAFAAAGNGLVSIAAPSAFTSAISGFGTGDVIDLAHLKAASLTYANGTLTLYDAHGGAIDTLSFAGAYGQSDFALMADGHGGTEILYAGALDARMPVTGHGLIDRPENHAVPGWLGIAMALER